MMEVPEEVDHPDSDVLPDDVLPEPNKIKLFDFIEGGNLVDDLDDAPGGASTVAALTLQLLDVAKQSMAPWQAKYDAALKLAKMEPEAAKKTFPFEDASTVMMPFILETMLDFHSRTVPELVWGKAVVGVTTYGKETEEKLAKATRTAEFMNYQIAESIPAWRPEQDKLLLALPAVGTGYKQTYFNGDAKEVASDLLLADEVIFDHNYKTFAEAPDKFLECEYTRNEVLTYIRGDSAWKLDESALPKQADHPDQFEFIRAFTWIDMDDDGLTEPYEVIIFKETETIVCVYAAYDEEEITSNDDGQVVDVKMLDIFTQYRFLPDPEGGPMGMGWGILLGDLFEGINTTMRQLIDAGTLANLAGNSGIIDAQMTAGSGRGNRQQSGPIEVRMGELTPVTTGGKPLSQSLVQFPYQGPNATLYQLTTFMIEQVRNMTNSALNMDTNSQEAAIMYLTRLQQGLKVPNSIVMRVYNCAKEEFKKIARLNFRHYSDEKYNKVLDEEQPASMRDDFDPVGCDIGTAVDPSQGSDVERQHRSTMILEEAKVDQAGVLNKRQAYLDWLEALKVPNVETLAPEPSGEPDPMQQLMVANMQREADLAEREMNLRESKGQLDQASAMLKAMKEGAEYGLSFDQTEAEIVAKYADAFKSLWEIGMDPIPATRAIEAEFLDKTVAGPPATQLDSPPPNPALQPEPAPQGAPPQ